MISTNDCWYYAGNTHSGYGRILGRHIAHRVMYENVVGEIPEGRELDHLCRNRSCVNPDHLEPVTHKENMRRWRGNKPGHCLKGHKLSPDNIYISVNRWGSPQRKCRICTHIRRRISRRRQKESI